MQWVHVSDLAEAIVLAGTCSEAANEVFNIAGNKAITVPAVAAAVREMLGPFASLDGARFQGHIGAKSRLKFSVEKAQTMLGYTPRVQFPEGLDEILTAMEHRRPLDRSWRQGAMRGPEHATR
jgi:nucleoside-diphosphate-sugar epimerase